MSKQDLTKLDEYGAAASNQYSLINNFWSLMNSIRTLQNNYSDINNIRAVVENLVLVLNHVGDFEKVNAGVEIERISMNSYILFDKVANGNINTYYLQSIMMDAFSLAGKKSGTAGEFIFGTTANIIASIINAQQNPDGTNSADVDIPLEDFFNLNNSIGFSAELLNTWSDFMDSISFTGETGEGLGDAAFWIWEKAIKSETMYDRMQMGTSEVDTMLGTFKDDYFFGLNGNDYLYGGGGKDNLNGGNGNDHLFGGESEDTLFGASDNDELYGGSKNDYLNGGKGDDILDGGEDDDILVDELGDDTYIFNGNFGYDTIYDVDGKGKIKINGEILKVGEKQNDVLWLSEDGKYYINLQPDFDGVTETEKLIITAKNPEEDQNTIVIKNWKNSHLGVSLTEAESSHGSPITDGIGTDGDDYITDSVYYTDGSGFSKDKRDYTDYVYNSLTDRFSVQSLMGNDSVVLDDKNYFITLGGGQVKKVITGDGHIMVLASNASDQIFTGAGSDSILLENDPSSFYQKKPEEFEVIYENKTTYKFYSDRYNFASTGAGKDLIVGGITKDIVYAGDHEDIVSGGGGNDEIYGENGNDIIYGDNHVLVNYRFMNDRWDVSDTASNANDLDMERLTNPYLLDNEVWGFSANTNWGYHGVDRIYGGKGDDRIFGQGGADYLYGGDENDIISGDFTFFVGVEYVGWTLDENGVSTVTEEEKKRVLDVASRHRYEFSGEDYLDGGLGNDRLLGGLKNDQLYGGEGDDWIYGDSDLAQEIFIDSVLDRSMFNHEWVTQLADDERFTKIYTQFVDENNNPLWTANDYVEGGKGKDHIFTEEGNDTAYGGADDDVIYGDWSEFEVKDKYHGNDVLHGDDGKDIIYGDGGDDQVFGGNDNDLLYGDGKDQEGKWHGNDKLFGGDGDDQILGQGGDDEIDGGDGKEYINGDDDKLDGQWHGKDKICGGNGQDYIIGNGKADVIYGGDGIDKIYGDSDILNKAWHGDDELYGDSGNDIIYAGGGNDKITGGVDHDQLYGEEGNDEYYFKKGDGQDIIFETSGQDKIIFEDVNSNEVLYFRMKDHLIITGYHQGDLISISDFFKDNDKKIESIVFKDKEVNISSIINEQNKVLDLPYDESTGQSYAVVEKKTNNDSIEINNKEKAAYIINGFDNSLQINDSENIILVGSGEYANNYYGHNSNKLKITGGNGTDYYRFTGEMDVYLNDASQTGIIEISTLSNYFEWKYDISCYGWFVWKSPAEMDLITSGEYANHYKINENSTRLNEVIYDASAGKLLIQNNTSSYVNAKGPGESQTLPVIPDIVPYEKKVQANIFLENLFSRNDVDVAMSSMQVHLGEYSYALSGQKTVVIDAVTLSLQDYINQGNVTAYYTEGDDLISGLTNKIRSEHYSDRLENYFETVYAGAGNDQINLGLGSSVIYAESGDDYIIAPDIAQIDVVYGGDGNDLIYNFDPLNQNQVNTYSSSVDLIYGGEGDDMIYINYQTAEVYGGIGNDMLYAGDYGVSFNGGEDRDTYTGGLGDDHYYYHLGDGFDIVDQTGGGNDIIHLSGIELDDVEFVRENDDLILIFNDDSNSGILIKDHYLSGENAIGGIKFEDSNTIINASDIVNIIRLRSYNGLYDQIIEGSSSSETLYGTSQNDLIEGLEGNDTIWAQAGNDGINGGAGNDYLDGGAGNDYLDGGQGDDTLRGGTGHDILDGGAGNDKYFYYLADGTETIDQTGGGTDVLWLMDQGITEDRIKFSKENNDLIVTIDNNANQSIRVKDHFLGGEKAISSVQPNGGYTITAAQIAVKVNASSGGTLDPAGDTIYQYTSGEITITEQSGNDSILFKNGITFSQVGNYLTKSGDDLILKVNGSNTNKVMIKNFFLAGQYLVEALLFETGGQLTAEQIFGVFGLTIPSGTTPTPLNSVGDTTYNYSSGELTITEQSGNDKVIFKNGISFSQVGNYLSKSGDDLILKVNGSNTNKVTVKNFFLVGNYLVENFEFETGGNLTAEQIFGAFGLILPSTGGGNQGSSEVAGDTVYNYTTGALTITEHSGNDKVIFKNGITFNQVGSYLTKSGDDLILNLNGSNTNKVTVKNFFLAGQYLVETFQFETGGQITAEQIFGAFGITTPQQSAPANTAPENTDLDAFNTTYNYSSGVMVIDEKLGTDQVVFGNGITFSQIGNYLTKSDDDLILKVSGSDSNKVTVKDFFLGGAHEVESFNFETGGSISSQQIYQVFGVDRPANAEDEVTSIVMGDTGDNVLSSDAAVSELFVLNEGNDILKLLLNASSETAVDYVTDFDMVEDQVDLSQVLDSNVNSSNISDYIEIIYDANTKTNNLSIRDQLNETSKDLLIFTNQAEQLFIADLMLNQSIIY